MEHIQTLLLLCPFLFFTTMASDESGCPRPELGANIKMDGIQRYFNPGAELALSCILGYTPTSGPRVIVCGASGRWSGTNLECKPIVCPYPNEISNGQFHSIATTYQSVVTYSCNKGYILDGPSSAVCQANGTWSGEEPVCNPVKCGLAPIPKYGMIVYLRTIEGSTTVYGDSVTYKCLPPYAVIGEETARCTESGTWTETPECKVVTCPPPKSIDNGFMSNSDQRQFQFMEAIRYGCDKDYELLGNMEIVCQKDGRWSETPSCRGVN